MSCISCLWGNIDRNIDNIDNSNNNNDIDIDVLNESKRVMNGESEKNNDIIILKELRKVFPKSKKKPLKIAVKKLSFGVKNGECFGFLGSNGAGNF